MNNNTKHVIEFWIRQICDFLRKQDFSIDPLPTIRIMDSDEQQNDAFDILIPTGGYMPSTNTLFVPIDNRHIKDILRSFCHEIVHHHQWLENPQYINSIYRVQRISEDPELEEIEKEAYLNGNILFRKFTESVQLDVEKNANQSFVRETELDIIQKAAITELTERQVKEILDEIVPTNSRFNLSQFTKYFGVPKMKWCGVVVDGDCKALLVYNEDLPLKGYFYISEIQTFEKGFGKILLMKFLESHKKTWLMADVTAGKSLIDFYQQPVFSLDKYVVPNSTYGCPANFFYTPSCDISKLSSYIDMTYSEDSLISEDKKIVGLEGMTIGEVKAEILDFVDDRLSEYEIDVEVDGIELHGSRLRGDSRDDSDLDAVIHYNGALKEDFIFNILNEMPQCVIDGVVVDINPIRDEETGSLKQYMDNDKKYDLQKKNQTMEKLA